MKVPYITTNFSQALALHIAGAEIIRVMNCYTEPQLTKMGFRSPEEALAKGKLGAVYYFIAPHERIEQFIAVYDETEREETEGEISPEDAVRLARHVMKLRRDLQETIHSIGAAWVMKIDQLDAETIERLAASEKAGQEISFSLPGSKFMKAGAPESTRKRLGL